MDIRPYVLKQSGKFWTGSRWDSEERNAMIFEGYAPASDYKEANNLKGHDWGRARPYLFSGWTQGPGTQANGRPSSGRSRRKQMPGVVWRPNSSTK